MNPMVQPLLRAPSMRVAAIALVSAIAIASSGCAAMAAKAPDVDRPVNEVPRCNTGKGGVAVDTVVALLVGVSAIAVAADDPGPGVALGLVAGAYGVSAAVGNSSANKCKKALEEYDEYIAGEQGLGGLAAASPSPSGPTQPPVPEPPTGGPTDPYADPVTPPVAVVPPKPPPPRPAPPKPAPPRPAAPEPEDEGGEEPAGDDPWGAFWQEVSR